MMQRKFSVALLSLLLVTPGVLSLSGCIPLIAAGAATAVVAGQDPRTLGAITEDKTINFKAANMLASQFGKDDMHVNVNSYNRMVLLTGEVPDATRRADVERVVRSIENVRGVYDELTVAGNSSIAARTNDSYLTTKVKMRFIGAKGVDTAHLYIVTEAGVVYLFGIVKHAEGNTAAQLASTTGGVLKVVTLFEYLD